jgi:glycosyltransferase involved in cell wall biosynthesis
MKIALGMKLRSGPFGGGNQFGNALRDYLESQGVKVIDHLSDNDIDIIMMTDPRKELSSCAFSPVEILNYVKIHPKAIVVHRINECDERKSTTLVNSILAKTNSVADHTIYIASWLIDLFQNQGLKFTEDYSVVLNGANPKHFFPQNKTLELSEPIKIVTHHWGGFWEKGWDIYLKLDELLGQEKYKNKIEFHYIGNPIKNEEFSHIIVHPPTSGEELGMLLGKNDIYLTGSMNEPAGMHHIEGALCGLPLLYRNSGALPEYCNGYGVMFNDVNDFENALDEIIKEYSNYKDKILNQYDNTSEKMCKNYYNVFMTLYKDRENIIKKRVKNKYSLMSKINVFLECLKYRVLTRLGKK